MKKGFRSTGLSGGGTGVCVLSLILVFASPAGAAVVRVANGTLAYNAAQGEVNLVDVAEVNGKYRVSDSQSRLRAGRGCRQVDPRYVQCDSAAVTRLTVATFDRSDSVDLSAVDGPPEGDVTVPAVVVLGTGSDSVVGGQAGDLIFGDEGADDITGGLGDDRLVGGADADRVSGGDGSDQLWGKSGDDELAGGPGPDVLFGGDDRDTMSGGKEADYLLGEAGNDAIDGGSDADVLNGGPGRDDLSGDAGSDDLSGEEGEDYLSGGPDSDVLRGGDGADSLSGEEGSDFLLGDAGEDGLNGGSEADLLVGGLEADYLNGGEGADQLWGDDGDDTLTGDSGPDSLDGGTGSDHFDIYDGEADRAFCDVESTSAIRSVDRLDSLIGSCRPACPAGATCKIEIKPPPKRGKVKAKKDIRLIGPTRHSHVSGIHLVRSRSARPPYANVRVANDPKVYGNESVRLTAYTRSRRPVKRLVRSVELGKWTRMSGLPRSTRRICARVVHGHKRAKCSSA
jgi:Ca2+-binding RTX toxin-like protein